MSAMTRSRIAVGVAALGIGAFFALRGCGADDEPTKVEAHASSAPVAPNAKPRAIRRTAASESGTTSQNETAVDPRLAAALELKRRIVEQTALRTPVGANESLRLLIELDRGFKEESIRTAVGFLELAAATVAARDALFRAELPRHLFATMGRVIDKRIREAPADDTFAAARRWTMLEFPASLWNSVSADLGLKQDELEKFWKSRDVATPRRATYGTGSFIVAKGTRQPDGVGPAMTEDDWWAGADVAARAAWLTAHFAESSGYFRIDDAKSAPCPDCSGEGFIGRRRCITCNGFGVVRTVTYR